MSVGIFPKFVAAANFTLSESETVMEVESGRVLFRRNENEKLPMASTTKIVTAITVIENCDLNSVVEIGEDASGIEGSSVYLKKGEKFSVKDLLYGLLLRSGNDCAEALATYCGGNGQTFLEMMHSVAKKCGAFNTRFSNPHGLPCDNHYTTAYDLCKIACYCLKNKEFSEIVSTKKYVASELNSGEKRVWLNKNKLLNSFEGADGVKTGYTKSAGKCFVGSATRKGARIVCVVLNSPQMFDRAKELLENAFGEYDLVKIVDKTKFDYLLLSKDKTKSYRLSIRESFIYPLCKNDKLKATVEIPPYAEKDAKSGDKVGKIEIYLSNELIFSENIYIL